MTPSSLQSLFAPELKNPRNTRACHERASPSESSHPFDSRIDICYSIMSQLMSARSMSALRAGLHEQDASVKFVCHVSSTV